MGNYYHGRETGSARYTSRDRPLLRRAACRRCGVIVIHHHALSQGCCNQPQSREYSGQPWTNPLLRWCRAHGGCDSISQMLAQRADEFVGRDWFLQIRRATARITLRDRFLADSEREKNDWNVCGRFLLPQATAHLQPV